MRTLLVAIALTIFVSLVAGMQSVEAAGATYPRINVSSIYNMTFPSNNLILNFTVDEPTSWMAYSLDWQPKIDTNGSIPLSNLTDGKHSLHIYANDSAGNMAVAMTSFTIENSSPHTSLAVPVELAVGIAAIGTISIALLIYFKKYRIKK